MPRPVIGLTSYGEPQLLSGVERAVASLPASYVRAIDSNGGVPVLLPISDSLARGAGQLLDRLDGLVLCGGADIEPRRYGEQPHRSVIARPDRDAVEFALLREARERDLPVLGVCRGLQLMAVAAGGRLHQHLPDVLGSDLHRPAGPPRYGSHPVRLNPGSLAHRILGDEVEVNSLHHQGVIDAGTLTPSGRCPADGLIEVVEDPGRAFYLAVQWHPEDLADQRVFAAMIEAARRGGSIARGQHQRPGAVGLGS